MLATEESRKVGAVLKILRDEPLDNLDERERKYLKSLSKKGLHVSGIMIAIEPRGEYPQGWAEVIKYRNGQRIVVGCGIPNNFYGES